MSDQSVFPRLFNLLAVVPAWPWLPVIRRRPNRLSPRGRSSSPTLIMSRRSATAASSEPFGRGSRATSVSGWLEGIETPGRGRHPCRSRAAAGDARRDRSQAASRAGRRGTQRGDRRACRRPAPPKPAPKSCGRRAGRPTRNWTRRKRPPTKRAHDSTAPNDRSS